MAARTREICLALGTPESISARGASGVTGELKAYSAPDALGAVYQDAVKFLRRRETAETIDNFPV